MEACGCECLTYRSRCASYHTADLYSWKCVSTSGENPSWLTLYRCFPYHAFLRQTDRQSHCLENANLKKRKKSSTACCHALVLSCMIYEIGGFTWLLLCVCAQGQMELMHVLPYIYIIPVCSQVAPLLLLVLSSLTNMIHHAMQSNSSKNNPSLSCTG